MKIRQLQFNYSIDSQIRFIFWKSLIFVFKRKTTKTTNRCENRTLTSKLRFSELVRVAMHRRARLLAIWPTPLLHQPLVIEIEIDIDYDCLLNSISEIDVWMFDRWSIFDRNQCRQHQLTTLTTCVCFKKQIWKIHCWLNSNEKKKSKFAIRSVVSCWHIAQRNRHRCHFTVHIFAAGSSKSLCCCCSQKMIVFVTGCNRYCDFYFDDIRLQWQSSICFSSKIRKFENWIFLFLIS